MTWAFTIDKYRIWYGADVDQQFTGEFFAPPFIAVIECQNAASTEKAYIQFDENASKSTTNVHKSSRGAKVYHKTDSGHYQNYLDTLRNEGPVAVAYDEGRQGISDSGKFFIMTLYEPIGEGEFNQD